MRFGARVFLRSKEPFNNIIQRARFCEKLGFDSVFIDDHLLYGTSEASAPEPFTTLTALAAETRKIRVGIAVTDLVRRHPAIVAQAMATLATIAPRRVFLGLGAPVPVYLAAFGRKMLQLTGQEADGWVPHCHTSKTYRQDLEIIEKAASMLE